MGDHLQFKALAAQFALVLTCALMAAGEVSGIQIRGNANTWWAQAEGRYERGHTPKVGAVLAFEATHRMRVGHVATVSKVVSDREVLLTHANWSRPGRIERDVRAVDVSAAGDWSEVKVWYAPQGGLGLTAYPARGFIYADHAADVELASNDVSTGGE